MALTKSCLAWVLIGQTGCFVNSTVEVLMALPAIYSAVWSISSSSSISQCLVDRDTVLDSLLQHTGCLHVAGLHAERRPNPPACLVRRVISGRPFCWPPARFGARLRHQAADGSGGWSRWGQRRPTSRPSAQSGRDGLLCTGFSDAPPLARALTQALLESHS